MIRQIQSADATQVLDKEHRKKYARGADVTNVEYPRESIEDYYESLDIIKPVGPVEGSAPLRSIRRDDRRFDTYA